MDISPLGALEIHDLHTNTMPLLMEIYIYIHKCIVNLQVAQTVHSKDLDWDTCDILTITIFLPFSSCQCGLGQIRDKGLLLQIRFLVALN